MFTEHDTDPIVVELVKLEEHTYLELYDPLVLKPQISRTGKYLVCINETFGMDVVAPTRHQLKQDILVELAILWKQYVRADNKKMTVRAKQMQRAIKSSGREVFVA